MATEREHYRIKVHIMSQPLTREEAIDAAIEALQKCRDEKSQEFIYNTGERNRVSIHVRQRGLPVL